MSNWELDKENIQPLTQGRDFQCLSETLLQEDDEAARSHIKKIRKEFESALRSCDETEDPLDIWYRYIVWTEQAFPRGGKDGNLANLLEQCVVKFKDAEHLHDDDRYVYVWLKLAGLNNDQLEMYEFMYQNNIGTKKAELYRHWADALEQAGDMQKADQVYRCGLKCKAAPYEMLLQFHSEFESRTARRTMEELMTGSAGTAPDESVRSRAAFNELVPKGRQQQAPIDRVAHVHAPDRQSFRPVSSAKKPASNAAVVAHSEAPDAAAPSYPAAQPGAAKPVSVVDSQKENQFAPARWTNSTVATKAVDKGKKFQVYTEDTDQSSKSQPIVLGSSALVAHKPAEVDQKEFMTIRQEWSGATSSLSETKLAAATSESKQSSGRATAAAGEVREVYFWRKNELYCGNEEYQFEELRAQRWFAKNETDQLRERVKWLEDRLTYLEQLHNHRPTDQSIYAFLTAAPEPSDAASTVADSHRSASEQPSLAAHRRSPQPFADSSLASSQGRDPFAAAEPTISTREAQKVMQDIFCRPIGFDEPKAAPVAATDGGRFAVFVDSAAGAQPPERPTLARNLSAGALRPRKPFGCVDDAPAPAAAPAAAAPALPAAAPAACPRATFFLEPDAPASKLKPPTALARDANSSRPTSKTTFAVFADEPNQQPSAPGSVVATEAALRPAKKPFGVFEETAACDAKPAGVAKATLSKSGAEERAASTIGAKQPEAFAVFDETASRASVAAAKSAAAGAAKKPFAVLEDRSRPSADGAAPRPPAAGPKPPLAVFDENPPAHLHPPSTAPLLRADQLNAPHADHLPEPRGVRFTAAAELPAWKGAPAAPAKGGFAVFDENAPSQQLAPPTRPLPNAAALLGNRAPAGGGSGSAALKKPFEAEEPHGAGMPADSAFKHPALPTGGALRKPDRPADKDDPPARQASGGRPSFGGRLSMIPHFHDQTMGLPADEGEFELCARFVSTPCASQPAARVGALADDGARAADPADGPPRVARRGPKSAFFSSTRSSLCPNPVPLNQPALPPPQLDADPMRQSQLRQLSSIAEDSREGRSTASSESGGSGGQTKLRGVSRPTLSDVSEAGSSTEIETGRFDLHNIDNELCSAACSPLSKSRLQADPLHHTSVIDVSHFLLYSVQHPPTPPVVASAPVDPFDGKERARLSHAVEPRLAHRTNYLPVAALLPTFKTGTFVRFPDATRFAVGRKVGTGAYATIFAAMRQDEDTQLPVVLKIQRPALLLEFYICCIITDRLQKLMEDDLDGGLECIDCQPGFIQVDSAFFFQDGSCFVQQYCPNGSIVSFVNKIKQETGQNGLQNFEAVCCYAAIELLWIVHQLHRCEIIHADIKPDNIMIMTLPELEEGASSFAEMIGRRVNFLKLIDFGRSIDLRCYPNGTQFVSSDGCASGFDCIEMKTDRPWTFQVDLFGLLGSLHVLMFGEYMKVYHSSSGLWRINKKLPRHFNAELWTTLFDELLNVPSCAEMPDLRRLRLQFERFFIDTFADSAGAIFGAINDRIFQS